MERTFLFADLSGFTALTEAHGDADAAAIVERFVDITEASLHGETRFVKSLGDAVMIVATSPLDGVSTAFELARRIEAAVEFPAVRAGLNLGPAVERGGDYIGAAVNLAARVAAHARAGQILCTEPVAAAVPENAGLTSIPLGAVRFKNIAEPVTLFDLADPSREKSATETDPVCQMQVDPQQAPGRLLHAYRIWYFCSLRCARAFAARPDTYASTS